MQSLEELQRIRVPQLEEVLGKPFPILDDGFVRVIDYMGSDEAVVQAARVSYGKGTRKVSEDRTLIRYLMRHRHTTPFEMCEIKFHLRVPMDCWRQWIRHRTASVNEYSTRYSIAIDASQTTPPDAWRLQATQNNLHRGVLENRPEQPASFPFPAHGSQRPVRDSPICRDDRERNRAPLVSSRLGGVP